MSKYIQPIPLDELPETPAVYGEMIEEYKQTKRNVSRDIEVEGLGKGRLVIRKRDKGKPFFYADEANVEANLKAAKQLQTAETLTNLPLILAPFFSIAKGGQRIIKQSKDNQIKKSVLGAQDLDKVKNVIDLVSSKAKGTVKPEIPSKTTAPTTSIMNMYKDTGITPQQKQVISNIVLQQGTTNDIESYGFGPEGPRGGATDAQIMQAYREVTGELDLDPFRGKTPEQATRDEVAKIVNPESDLNLFKNTGEANIRRIRANFTENELRQLKSFENHHNVPLKQSGWLVYGLPSDELAKTQFYLAQRGVKGGNVLEQIRIYPEGIHDQAHELGERIIGQMRKRRGYSIEKILGDLDPADYAKIQTFEGRKQYIDKFIDGITEIETKINKILDALYANRLNDDTALEALIDINENVDDPKVLGILDDLLKQIENDPFIQKPLDDSRALQVRIEDKSLARDLNKFLRGALERNRQKFSKFDTFDDALDAAEQILEKQGGGQRKLFYDADGNERYVSFTEQAERLARLLFENQ